MSGRLSAWMILVVLLSLGVQTVAAAMNDEDAEPTPGPRGPTRPVLFQIRYLPSFQSRTDFSQADGSVASRRQDLSGTAVIFLPEQRGRLLLTGSYDWLEFRFRDNEVLEGRLKEARAFGLNAVYLADVSEKWSIFAIGGLQTAAESGASLGNDRAYNGSALAQYQLRDNLQIGMGFIAMDHWDEGRRFFPIASVDWRVTERLGVQTSRGLNVRYRLDERGHWIASWNTEFFSQYIRLNDEGEGAGGIFRSRAIVSSLSMLYQPNPGMTFGAEVGTSLWRSLRIRDPERQTVFRSRTETGLSGALIASLTF